MGYICLVLLSRFHFLFYIRFIIFSGCVGKRSDHQNQHQHQTKELVLNLIRFFILLLLSQLFLETPVNVNHASLILGDVKQKIL